MFLSGVIEIAWYMLFM